MGATTFSEARRRAEEARRQQSAPAPPVEPRVSWRLNHKGGGWYQIFREDELVEEIRGADAAEDRLSELRGD